MIRRHISSRHAAQTWIEPSKDTFWMSLLGFAGVCPGALSTAVESTTGPVSGDAVMCRTSSMLGSRNNLSTVSCYELLRMITAPCLSGGMQLLTTLLSTSETRSIRPLLLFPRSHYERVQAILTRLHQHQSGISRIASIYGVFGGI